VDVLRRMEKFDIRTSTLLIGTTSYRLAGQEVQRCALFRYHQRFTREVSGTGLIILETTGRKVPVGKTISGLSSGGSDIYGWDVVTSASVFFTPLYQGV
jgi:hypothetical protein